MTASFNTIARRLSPRVPVIAVPDIQDVSAQIEAGTTVYDALSTIASGRGLWAQPRPDGSLRFSRIATTAPVATLSEGDTPIISIETTHWINHSNFKRRRPDPGCRVCP